MEGAVETLISRLNIENYKNLLDTSIDETRRQMVMRLLAEEQAKLVEVISKTIVRETEKAEAEQVPLSA